MSRKSPFWRSPEQLAGDPEVRNFQEGEFPEGAHESPGEISRRRMLAIMGATASMAGLAACRRPEEAIVPYVVPPEEMIPGVPRYYATTMPLGNSAYGLVVETHEGRPSKIEGNLLHPSTLGSSSALIQAAIYGLYDPDRSRWIREGDERRDESQLAAALAALRERHLAGGGEGLAVLAQPFSSPTLYRLAQQFREQFPQARWVTWSPCGEENSDAGIAAATGRTLVPMLHPGQAEIIFSLDADFLVGDAEAIRHAREFADGRRLADERDTMNRLYVAESRMSPTGAMADHRLRLKSGRMGALLAALATALGVPGAESAGTAADHHADWVRGLATDLRRTRGNSLILAGSHLPAAVHAAVVALNQFLGNVGHTITYRPPADSFRSRGEDLPGLVAALSGGGVRTLMILGGNPVYDAPADLKFLEALTHVETVIHLGLYHHETGRAAHWHVPEAHFLEAWGDARAVGGGLSVVQPLIAPLHGGRTMAELLSTLVHAEPSSAYDLLRETWSGILPADTFDLRWQELLHDGYLKGSALPAEGLSTVARIPSRLSEGGDDGLEIVFQPGGSVLDGRFANISWLQELPDPVTKLTWDNAAWISPSTARSLEVKNGDLIRLSGAGGELEIAALVVPGQADDSIGLTLGYGRRAAGRIGDGVGFDTYVLRTTQSPWIATGVNLARTGRAYPLALTQDHWDMDEIGARGRDERLGAILRTASLEKYRSHPDFAREEFETPALESIYPDHSYDEGPQWGMAIDLSTCTGCNACVLACQSENNIPVVGKDEVARGREMHWIRIDRYYTGPVDDPDQMAFQPVTCQHCENAPCEEVCPVSATVHDDEGLNVMVYNRCIGTRYCSNNCPYKVRRFNYYNLTKDTPELLKMAANPDVTIRSRGVMEKCTFCTQRIQAAKIDAKAAGRPLAADEPRTACQQACPTQAIAFGNILDPRSKVFQQKKINRNYELLAELNNRPRNSYLAKISNPRPGEGKA
ncbi:MAG: TAT-variant-translocated molybdopterin oxidoreductase [Acidobacteria bacterium]|nr:TAT-variant-translocated molybdopterin oxidoreductase [Acidobacteriota bacterium]